MLSENDKEKIREVLGMSHEDIQVFNLEYIYQKVEDLMNKEIFTEYVNYLKENPEAENNLLNDEINLFENKLYCILSGTFYYECNDKDEYYVIMEVVYIIRNWLRDRDGNPGAAGL